MSVESAIDEYEQKKSRTVAEISIDFFNSIANAGIPQKKISFYYKRWPITYTYPEENLIDGFTGYVNFTDLAFEFKEYGKYQIIFGIDGIETSYFDGCLMTV